MESKRIRSKGNAGRCSKQSSKKRYERKRVHYSKIKSVQEQVEVEEEDGADFTIHSAPKLVEKVQVEVEAPTASASKIIDIEPDAHSEELSGYRLMDITILNNIMNSLACPECYVNTLNLHDINEKQGTSQVYETRMQFLPICK